MDDSIIIIKTPTGDTFVYGPYAAAAAKARALCIKQPEAPFHGCEIRIENLVTLEDCGMI